MKLIAICAIAGAIVVKNGLLQNEIKPIKIKRHKPQHFPAKSLFTYGLDNLKHAITNYSKKLLLSLFRQLLEPLDISTFSPQLSKIVG